MLFQILKKDMMKRKGVNIILFLFVSLATVFLASSINNIMVVGSAVNYYMDYANVPDLNLVANSSSQREEIHAYLDEQQQDGLVFAYDYNEFTVLNDKSIKKENGKSIDTKGASLYLSTMDVDYAKVYDEDGKDIILADNEIAMYRAVMERNNLKANDKISVQLGDVKKEFIIKTSMKDAAFGSEMMGMSRFMVSQKSYDEFQKDASHFGVYYIMTPNATKLTQEVSTQQFETIINTIPRTLYMMVYSFDMIMAGLLILIGICLILIALLVLRFTLVFTMEEQYHEIGILKAIGLRDYAIKKMYLVKYFVIVSVGSFLGMLCSIPVSNIMVKSVSKNMIMESSDANFFVNVICCFVVIILVLSFCYFCTRKLNKVSAITAIRGGQDGERFHKLKGLHLSKRKRMKVSTYLGMNDILCEFKKFLILVFTFTISFILITIPVNTLNTMRSDEMGLKFALNPESAVYVRNIEQDGEQKYNRVSQLDKAIKRITNELEEKGYEDVSLNATPIFFLSMSSTSNTQNARVMTLQSIGEQTDYLTYDDGSAPTLENEIAIASRLLEENNWAIGDYIDVNINGTKRKMIISGTYSDYMQLGKSARLNPIIQTDQEVVFDYWTISVNMKTDMSQEEASIKLQSQFPDYEWLYAQKLIDQNVGGIQDALQEMILPMTLLLCVVIMLITLLMEKLFITREKGQIAMMKSIGVPYKTIRNWQMIRMILVVFSSMLVSIPLSLLSNEFVLKPIFSTMGADVAIQVNPLEVYMIYPGILLFGIVLATYIAVNSVKRIDIQELNNLE